MNNGGSYAISCANGCIDDCRYVSSRTRAPGEINGKSGNLNNALRNVIYKDYESPADIPPEELVVVFDADMAAKKSFFVKVNCSTDRCLQPFSASCYMRWLRL